MSDDNAIREADNFGPEFPVLLALLQDGGEVTDLRFSFDEDGEMTWHADVAMPGGWKPS